MPVKLTSTQTYLFVLFAAVTAFSSILIFGAHTAHFALFAFVYFIFLLAVGVTLTGPGRNVAVSFLTKKSFWISGIVLLALFDEFIYITRVWHHPDVFASASALMVPARNFLAGHDPYAVHIQGGAPISPGPGWIVLLSPITLAGNSGLLTALAACMVLYLIARKSHVGAGIFVLLTILQPVLVEISARGTDLFSIALVYAAICLFAEEWSGKRVNLVLLGVLTGFFVQSRAPMVVLLLFLGLGLWRRNRQDALRFLVPAVLTSVAVYAFFYLWTVHDHVFFQAFHVFDRGRQSGIVPSVLGPILGACVLVVSFLRMCGRAEDWILAGGLMFLALFGPVGLGELLRVWHNIQHWEGASYFSLGMPLVATYLGLTFEVTEKHPLRKFVR